MFRPFHQRRDAGPGSAAKSSRSGLTPSIRLTVRRFTAPMWVSYSWNIALAKFGGFSSAALVDQFCQVLTHLASSAPRNIDVHFVE